MDYLDGDMNLSDIISLAATIGFAEESLREEEGTEEENDIDTDLYGEHIKDVSLVQLRRTNPDLYRRVLLNAIKLQRRFEAAKKLQAAKEENKHELEALEATEKLLEK